MYPRSFFSKMNPQKTKLQFLQPTVEWHTPLTLTPQLEKQIVQTHLASFLDLYQDFSEEQLGLETGKTKENWLREMILSELDEFKSGKVFLATVCLENNIAGFITCYPTTPRHHDRSSIKLIVNDWSEGNSNHSTKSKWQDSISNDVYISLLAVKPFYDSRTNKKIQIGLGRQLIESAEIRFTKATALTLDTRLINTSGIAFYKKLGFLPTEKHTFHGANPTHYIGCEKKLITWV